MKAEGTAVITGASRGIGRALALELARRGFEVVATMRNPAAGETLVQEARAAGLRLRVERLDVCDPGGFRMPQELRVLINNAAIEVDYLPIEHTPAAQWRAIFETNVIGLVEVTRLAIPPLRESGGGVICNITSSSLLFPMPFYSAYRASKAAVSAIGESLRAELAPFGIRVLEILPGPTRTDMLAGSDRLPEAAAHAPYRELAERALAGRRAVETLTSPVENTAAAIAEAVLDDTAPLRCACDELGRGLLEGWRRSDDEQWLRQMLDAFAAPANRKG